MCKNNDTPTTSFPCALITCKAHELISDIWIFANFISSKMLLFISPWAYKMFPLKQTKRGFEPLSPCSLIEITLKQHCEKNITQELLHVSSSLLCLIVGGRISRGVFLDFHKVGDHNKMTYRENHE